jgi:TusA-related sulfurtransferase
VGTNQDKSPDLIVDTRGSFCPVPIIKLSEAVRNIDRGGVVELISDDAAIQLDLPAWCRSTGHRVISESHGEREWVYRVQKAGGAVGRD